MNCIFLYLDAKSHEISNSLAFSLDSVPLGRTSTSSGEYSQGIRRGAPEVEDKCSNWVVARRLPKIILHRPECRVFVRTCEITNCDCSLERRLAHSPDRGVKIDEFGKKVGV